MASKSPYFHQISKKKNFFFSSKNFCASLHKILYYKPDCVFPLIISRALCTVMFSGLKRFYIEIYIRENITLAFETFYAYSFRLKETIEKFFKFRCMRFFFYNITNISLKFITLYRTSNTDEKIWKTQDALPSLSPLQIPLPRGADLLRQIWRTKWTFLYTLNAIRKLWFVRLTEKLFS